MADITVSEPFPIFLTAHRYLLYDVNTITHARRAHHITGVLIGGLPQAPQQNVFSGIPLELMPEEARLLVERAVAYIVDDVAAHKRGFLTGSGGQGLSAEERKRFMGAMERQGAEAARKQAKAALDRKTGALRKIAAKNGVELAAGTDNWNDIPDDMFGPRKPKAKGKGRDRRAVSGVMPESTDKTEKAEDEEELLFESTPPQTPARTDSIAPSETPSAQSEEAMKMTPTTSYPPLRVRPPSPSESLPLPDVPSSYPLFKYLHSKDYFLAPGLRFGCQYMAYPGDPLRFHSHFLCNGMDWDQEFDLLDIVGGGRLGTGVKKGFLIGGLDKDAAAKGDGSEKRGNGEEGLDDVRAFCVEWGGM